MVKCANEVQLLAEQTREKRNKNTSHTKIAARRKSSKDKTLCSIRVFSVLELFFKFLYLSVKETDDFSFFINHCTHGISYFPLL